MLFQCLCAASAKNALEVWGSTKSLRSTPDASETRHNTPGRVKSSRSSVQTRRRQSKTPLSAVPAVRKNTNNRIWWTLRKDVKVSSSVCRRLQNTRRMMKQQRRTQKNDDSSKLPILVLFFHFFNFKNMFLPT